MGIFDRTRRSISGVLVGMSKIEKATIWVGHIPLSFLAGSTEEAADRLTTLFEAHGQGAVNSTTIRKKDSHPNASWALVSFDDAVAAKRAMGCVIKVENAAAPL